MNINAKKQHVIHFSHLRKAATLSEGKSILIFEEIDDAAHLGGEPHEGHGRGDRRNREGSPSEPVTGGDDAAADDEVKEEEREDHGGGADPTSRRSSVVEDTLSVRREAARDARPGAFTVARSAVAPLMRSATGGPPVACETPFTDERATVPQLAGWRIGVNSGRR